MSKIKKWKMRLLPKKQTLAKAIIENFSNDTKSIKELLGKIKGFNQAIAEMRKNIEESEEG